MSASKWPWPEARIQGPEGCASLQAPASPPSSCVAASNPRPGHQPVRAVSEFPGAGRAMGGWGTEGADLPEENRQEGDWPAGRVGGSRAAQDGQWGMLCLLRPE